MEGPSTFEPESGKNSAEEIGGMGEGERPDSEHLQQDAGAQTTEDKRTRALAACMEQRRKRETHATKGIGSLHVLKAYFSS